MDRIFHNSDILLNIQEQLKNTENEMLIISAFTKLQGLKYIDTNLNSTVREKKLLVRFRLDDILSGATDIEIYDYCKTNNWRLFINLDLHSKIYLFDKRRVILGSANLTPSGIGLNPNHNIETAVLLEITPLEEEKIKELFNQSFEVTDKLFEEMLLQISLNEKKHNTENEWNSIIFNTILPPIKVLWVSDMLVSKSPFNLNLLDSQTLNINDHNSSNIVLIKKQFIKSKPYRWLTDSIENEAYFGQLSSMLHGALLDDPRPLREDVKVFLSNLFNWITELGIEEFSVDRPNHSQRIRRII
ncbi:phospholipase D-like domain-containing protein [Cytobacillus sp. S13-E01]|uniref:phospholipase D-like domain-containing protein n=1 Tax=Cytobacillus sp. S13-E01 TaxID=3031326 RepID=UPI0023D8AC9E|nr:phospholipase D-like domain-containing protein [Cytobacillus sp. S13-E01]MDF0728432.1 phospholipase D-like domain-containing protein [Cytobacillus sp. S13-E01]